MRGERASHTAAAVERHLVAAVQAEAEADRAEAEARDLAARDAALETSIASASQSARLLAGVEVQGRAALEQAAREARDERTAFAEKLRTRESRAQANEARLMNLAIYRRMKEVEAAVARRREEVEELRRRRRRREDVEGSRGEQLRRDKEGWMVFRKAVVGVAKALERGQVEEERLAAETRALEELAKMEETMRQEMAKKEETLRKELARKEEMMRQEMKTKEDTMRQEIMGQEEMRKQEMMRHEEIKRQEQEARQEARQEVRAMDVYQARQVERVKQGYRARQEEVKTPEKQGGMESRGAGLEEELMEVEEGSMGSTWGVISQTSPPYIPPTPR